MLKTTTITSTEITQQVMGWAAALTFLLGASLGFNGQASQAIMNFGIGLFFVFVYSNPDLVLKEMRYMEEHGTAVVQKKFLWFSIVLGLFAIAWETVGLSA